MTRNVVLYARLSVSSEESVSIARQLEACRKYAEARGWTVVGEFVDDGVSATVNRPEDRAGWKALLAAGGYDAVVVWKVDRLARRVLDFLHAHEALAERGAGLVAVEDPVDMTTPQGRAFAVMLSVFAEMEAETTRARVAAARAHILREGRWAGGSAPYGWRAVPNPSGPGVVLALDPARSAWVRGAAERALRGDTLYSVKRWLDREGAPTPAWRGVPFALPEWNYHSLWRLLRNPVLAGMAPRNPGRGRHGEATDPFAVVRDDAGLPVVDESIALMTTDEFRTLVSRIDEPGSPQARRRSDKETTSPLLSRAVQCDDCDVFMVRGTNQKRPVLNCPKCHMTLTRTTFEPYLVGRLLAERGDHPVIEAVRAPAPASGLGDVEEALRRATSEMMADGADVDALARRVKALREERSRLSRAPRAEEEWTFTGQTVREAWEAAGDDVARREVLLSQVGSLRIRRGVVGRYFDEARVLLEWHDASFTVV